MKKLLYSLMVAAALLACACNKEESVPNTGDQTGTLYGIWVLDTKTVDYTTASGGSTDQKSDVTSFTDEHFLLHLTNYSMAFAQKGTLLTFDIDDVDGTPYTYNEKSKQISFEKSLSLSAGLLPLKIMTLKGIFDVSKLTDSQLIIQQTKAALNNTNQITVYTFHRLVETSQ